VWSCLCLGCGLLLGLTSCRSQKPAATMGSAYAHCSVVDRMDDYARLRIVIVDSSCTVVPPLTLEIVAVEGESASSSQDASITPHVRIEAERSGDKESFDSDRILLPSSAPPRILVIGNCLGDRGFAELVQCARR